MFLTENIRIHLGLKISHWKFSENIEFIQKFKPIIKFNQQKI